MNNSKKIYDSILDNVSKLHHQLELRLTRESNEQLRAELQSAMEAIESVGNSLESKVEEVYHI